jgi:hypothetical protein
MAKRDGSISDSGMRKNQAADLAVREDPSELLRELVAHLRQNRTQLREEWVVRISETRLLTAMTKDEIFKEATSVYDSYVEALETETFDALQANLPKPALHILGARRPSVPQRVARPVQDRRGILRAEIRHHQAERTRYTRHEHLAVRV